MGQSLYENSAIARALYDEADRILGWSLKDVSFNGPESELTLTHICQPALYVHGYVGFELLQDAGKLDDLKVALGLSLGELTALAAANVFDFATGLAIVAKRGALMQDACDQTSGTMAAVLGGERGDIEAICEAHEVDVANYNCPGQTVISGDKDKIAAAVEAAKATGKFKRVMPLKVAGAYHSRLMEPARQAFAEFLADIPFNRPRITVFSNVTGGSLEDPEEIKAALAAQVVSSVRWEEDIRAAAAAGVQEFYECGPGAVLAGHAKRIDRDLKVRSMSDFADLSA
ncbi:MAG: acyl-carrier-protein S-malonyltransferase [Puniceicoccaceae bacterium 5H]|nr:MAG: acyl-carrier-protein S-malonyltransferase [Puniceicoccaceae bacterium 5H]